MYLTEGRKVLPANAGIQREKNRIPGPARNDKLKNMMNITIEKDGNKTILILSGELTIESASELKNAFVQILENTDHVFLDLKNVTEIDLSGLQLLCSAHRTSLHLKKSLGLADGYPQALSRAVEESGYLSRYSICVQERQENCLWVEISKGILCRT